MGRGWRHLGLSTAKRKWLRRELRMWLGDKCCHCGRPMLFDTEVPEQAPLFATIEHGDLGGEARLADLRLAHAVCNWEHDLRKKVSEGRARPGRLERFRAQWGDWFNGRSDTSWQA